MKVIIHPYSTGHHVGFAYNTHIIGVIITFIIIICRIIREVCIIRRIITFIMLE